MDIAWTFPQAKLSLSFLRHCYVDFELTDLRRVKLKRCSNNSDDKQNGTQNRAHTSAKAADPE